MNEKTGPQPNWVKKRKKRGEFMDFDFYPFLGLYYGVQLYKIPEKYWDYFLCNYDGGEQKLENRFRHKKTILNALRDYAKKRITYLSHRRENKLIDSQVKKHTKIYFNYFRINPGESVLCEIMGVPAQDIHHIECKGMGGARDMDFIENLMAATRIVHGLLGDITKWKDTLKIIHYEFMDDETPYIHKNPDHEVFDFLKGIDIYKPLIIKARTVG